MLWAKAPNFNGMPYPDLKVGVIDNQFVNGL
jgi:hypothetical protein